MQENVYESNLTVILYFKLNSSYQLVLLANDQEGNRYPYVLMRVCNRTTTSLDIELQCNLYNNMLWKCISLNI